MKYLIESLECWGQDSVFSRKDPKCIDDCRRILISLRHACTKRPPNTLPQDAKDTNEPNKLVQDILLSLGLQATLSSYIRTCDSADDHQRTLLIMVYKLMTQMISEHSANQSNAFEDIDKFLMHLDSDTPSSVCTDGVACVLVALFKNNHEFCKKAPVDLFYKLADRCARDHHPRYMEVLHTLLVVHGDLIPSSKATLLSLVQLESHDTSLLFSLFSSETELKELEHAVQKFSAGQLEVIPIFREWAPPDDKLLYATQCLGFLADLTRCREPMCERLVHSLAPATEIAEAYGRLVYLQNKLDSGPSWICTTMRAAYLRLMQEAYFNCAVKDENYLGSRCHYKFLIALLEDLKRCESEPIYAEAVCEIVCIFFTEAYDSEASYRLVPRLVKDGFIPALTQLCDGKLTLCAEEHCRTAMNCLNPTLRLLAVQPVYSSESPQQNLG